MSDFNVAEGCTITTDEAWALMESKKRDLIGTIKRFDVGDDPAEFLASVTETGNRILELAAFATVESEADSTG